MTVQEQVAKSRAEQGLPPKVEDPAVLMRIAHIITQTSEQPEGRPARSPTPRISDDFVYFIRSKEGLIKIGRSHDPPARLKSLATNIPGLELLATLPNGNREKEFHRRFAAHRAHGEWFRPAPPLLAFLEEFKWEAAKKALPQTEDEATRKETSNVATQTDND